MAGIEEELRKPAHDEGAEQHVFQHSSLQDDVPENGGTTKPTETADAATPLPITQPPDVSAHEPESPDEAESLASKLGQESPPDTNAAAAENHGLIAPEAQPSAAEPAKRRSLFPALAATALVGALLGLGGSYGLRFIDGASTAPALPGDRLNELNTRLDTIEGKEASASSGARSALAALESRVAAVEDAARKAGELAKAAEGAAIKAASAQPEAKEALAEGAGRAGIPDLGPLEARLAAIEQKLAQSQAETAPKTNLRAELDRERSSAHESARAQEVAIVAENLLRKIDHGEEFSAELSALENLGIPQSALAPLRAASGSAVLPERELAAQFAELSGKMIAAEQAASAGGGESFLDVVTRNAKTLVNVRRVGDSSGADVQSIVGRIESALAEHDINAAYSSFEELPVAAKNAGLKWGDAVKLRLDALNAAKSLEAEAVAILGKPER